MSESHKRARSPGRALGAAPAPSIAGAPAAASAAAEAAVTAAASAPSARKKSRFGDASSQPIMPAIAPAAMPPSPAASLIAHPAVTPAAASAPVADSDGFLSRASILAAAPKKPVDDDDDFRMPPPRPRAEPVAGSMHFGALAARPLGFAAAAGGLKPKPPPSPFGVPLAAPKKPIIVAKPMMGFNFLAAKKPASAAGAVTANTSTAQAKPSAPASNSLAPPATTAAPAPAVPMDDVDPLEAYMSGLSRSMTPDERKAVSGEAEKEERAAHKVHATPEEEAEERKESEAQNGKNAATSTPAVAVPSSAPSAAAASPAPAAATVAVASGPASAERFYGDEEQLDESVIEAHNSLAEAGGSQSWLEKQAKMKRKDIKPVDHSKMQYAPFRKDFYIESKEISAMSDAAVDAYREVEMEGVKIRGKRCPKPIREWHQCGLPDAVLSVIRRENYKAPFPIQQQAIPAIMSGRDCICCAKTGSGKTLAFVLPMLRHVLDQPPAGPGEGAIAIILAPTRELATQIHNEVKKFTKHLNLRAVCVYGGASVADQITLLKRGADIITATPGRMIDMLVTNSGRLTNLTRCTYLTLDEADRMFDMGFEPQISRILDNIRPDAQKVLFSATFPRSVETLAKKALKTAPLEIIIGGRSVASSSITQFVEVREASTKFPRLLEILGQWYPRNQNILVFVDKQEAVDTLFRQIIDAGYPALALHGGMDQSDRDYTITDFKSKLRTIMVATSIVARGLDVKDLTLVINYTVPGHYEDYVHRVGRTGRAGKPGTAITFVEPTEIKFAPDLVKGLQAAKQVVPKDLQAMADEFEAQRKAGLVKYSSNNGFSSGRGFKFDETEDAELHEKQRLRNLMDNPDADPDELQAVMDDVKTMEEKRAAKEAAARGTTTAGAAGSAAAPSSSPSPPAVSAAAAAKAPAPLDPIAAQLAIAKKAAAAAMAAMAAAQKTKLLGAGDSVSSQIADAKVHSAMEAARQAEAARLQKLAASSAMAQAALIAQRFMTKNPPPSSGSNPGGMAADGEAKRAFFSEVEINDYPQHARWKVTHKGALDAIIDLTDCAVTTKGGYIPPGRNPQPGERKLHLLVEGHSEIEVQRCKTEIIRMLEEAAADSRPDAPAAYSKYKVV